MGFSGRTKSKTPPRSRGRFAISRSDRSGSLTLATLLLLRCKRLLRLSGADLDLARLRCLGDLVDQIDMQHAVDKAGAHDLDVVGEAEAPLERAPRDTAMQVAVLVFFLFRLAGHH